MEANPALGVFLHAAGGLAAGSFYIPYKRVRGWAWESYWLAGGVFSWIIAPWAVAWGVAQASGVSLPTLLDVAWQTHRGEMLWTYIFGVLWGIGGLMFGLAMRYLGISLGYAVALGFCAFFGTIMVPIYDGTIAELVTSGSGAVTLGGLAVCLAGIAVCGKAGIAKERELPDEAKRATIREFSFTKGLWVAIFAGIMSACMSYGITAGKGIGEMARAMGIPDPLKNTPVLIVVLAGGFTTNFLWCVYLNVINRTGRDYVDPARGPLLANYFFAALAGTTWYLQFFFYSMGTTKMGEYDFSSWTLHMAFIIVFSNLWALLLHEWRGTGPRVHALIRLGILVLIASTVVVGAGSWLKARKAGPPSNATQPQEAAADVRHS